MSRLYVICACVAIASIDQLQDGDPKRCLPNPNREATQTCLDDCRKEVIRTQETYRLNPAVGEDYCILRCEWSFRITFESNSAVEILTDILKESRQTPIDFLWNTNRKIQFQLSISHFSLKKYKAKSTVDYPQSENFVVRTK